MEQPHKTQIFMNGRSPEGASGDASNARGWMLARLLIFFAVSAVGGFLLIACSSDFPPAARAAATLGALICLAFPLRVLYVGARRYYRTGSWTISPVERTAWRNRYLGRPSLPWISPALTAVVALVVLVNCVSSGIRLYRHHLSAFDGLLLAFWSIFLTAQIRQLYRELRKPSIA